MTRIEIYRKKGRVVGYKATGHSGYAEYGEDIVCAALSMALQLPLGGMQDVLDIYPKFEIDSDGYLSVDMRGMDNKGKEKEIKRNKEIILILWGVMTSHIKSMMIKNC